MIISRIVTPDIKTTAPCVTEYADLIEAQNALSQDWPMTTLVTNNVVVLADYDGCRLILQRAY